MENNDLYNELLVRYLAGEANAEESELVESWIRSGEDNRRYFENLRDAWQLAGAQKTLAYVLEGMNVDEKWRHFKETLAAREAAQGEQEPAAEAYADAEPPARRSPVYRLLVAAAIAASVLLVIGLAWKAAVQPKEAAPVVVTAPETPASPVAERHEVNTTGREKRLSLADGSLVVLAHQSEITYREPFTGKRDIYLKGKAFFRVAKDKTRPFTVTSGAIATTALGTEFTVTAFENAPRIIVRLYEGKVVVKAVDRNNRKLKKEVYLLPGQAFVYGSRTTGVKAFSGASGTAPEAILSEEASRDNPSLPQNAEGTWYMFNNQSLAMVLEQLEKMYQVEIEYNRQDVQNIYFTRKYNSQDSIDGILKEIAILNNLTVTRNNDTFVISK
ncbi:FecR domain-containing protein [Paraflavisolibacter sp. H34]|uniref:FecR family protein n=1 Tax=Huijunlia imazamoxiresistens TaxID=3127457 RepID=UPI0030181C2E